MSAPITTAIVDTISRPMTKSCFPVSTALHGLPFHGAGPRHAVHALDAGQQQPRQLLPGDENRAPRAFGGLAAARELQQLRGGARRQSVERLLEDRSEERRVGKECRSR